jgi:two-component system response regulator DevR
MTSPAWSLSSFGQELAQGTGFTLLGQDFGQHVVNGILVVVDACLRAGARGYLLKDAESLRLPERILTVGQGHVALDPRAADVLTNYLHHYDLLPELLNGRELQVLRLIAQGLTNKEIGEQLSLSENTVKGYVKEILAKLGVRNRVEAVLQAKERGLL